MNKIVLVPEDDEDYGVYNASGEVRAVLNDTTVDHGIHAANGAYRVTKAEEGSGVYATDGSYNFWYNTDGSINFPGGILKGVSETDLISELYAVDGTRPAAVADFEAWRFFIPQLGPELVTNGGFDTDSDWTKGSGVTISGGTLNADSTLLTNVALDSSDIVPVVGKLYLVVYTVTAVTNASGGVSVTFGGAVPVARTTTGTFSEYITAVNTETIKVYKRGASQWAGSIDNVSVREVMLGDFGANVGASVYTMSTTGGSAVAEEDPAGTLELTGASPFIAIADKTLSGLTVGKSYELRFSVVNNGNTVNVTVGTTLAGLDVVPDTNVGSSGLVHHFVATASTLYIRFRRQNAGLVTVNNIYIREAPSSPVLRECTFAEWFAYTSSTPAAETYTDQTGVIRQQTYGRNLLSYSEQFDNAAWIKESGGSGSAAVVTSNAGAAPDNTTTADRIQFALNGNTTTSDRSEARQVVTTTAADHTFSFWVRSFDGVSSYQMFVRDSDGTVNALVVTGSWQRYEIAKGTYPAGAVSIGIGIRGGQTPTNSDSADILIWGAQLEVGSSATTYKPTTSNGAGVDTPRQDYSLGSRRLLLENASTNLIQQSGNPNVSPWTGNTVGSGLTSATPVNAYLPGSAPYKYVSDAVTSSVNRRQNVSVTSGVVYTTTVFLEESDTSPATVTDFTFYQGAHVCLARLTWATLSVSVSSGAGTVTVSDLGIGPNGGRLAKVTSTCTATATGTATIYIYLGGAGSTSAQGVIIHGLQVEASSFASSYIPTQGSTVTRAINTAEFSPMLEAIMQRSAASVLVRGTHTSAVEGGRRVIGMAGTFMLIRSSTGTPSLALIGVDSGPSSAGTAFPGPFGIAMGFNSSGYSGSANGNSPGGASGVAVDARSVVYLGRSATVGGAARYGDGTYKLVAIYPTRLSNASLQALAVA